MDETLLRAINRVAKSNGLPEDWADGPHLAFLVDGETPPGRIEGERVDAFGHPARAWLREHEDLLVVLRTALTVAESR